MSPLVSYDTGRAAYYPVRLGPLRFTCLVGDNPEPLGDRLEAVGAALVPGERQPRAAQIVLPVMGSQAEVDPRGWGLTLRRQVRALMENTAWKQQGLYFEAGWDQESAAWLMVGGGNLTDEQRGFAFGDWRLTLEDAYLVGRPGSHRRGRRFAFADRSDGLTPTDTRGLLYTTYLSGKGDTSPRGFPIPGDLQNVRGYLDRPPSMGIGPTIDGRTLWRRALCRNGEVLTWRPNAAVLPAPREREQQVEDVGSVRVWRMPAYPGATSSVGDRAPDLAYGWEQVMGDADDYAALLAVENGWVRLVWLGAQDGGGLRLERWDLAQDRYVPVCRVLHAKGASEVRVVELTPERAVLSWWVDNNGLNAEMRAILCRGWDGPRIEVYGYNARLTVAGDSASRSNVQAGVDRVTVTGGGAKVALTDSGVDWTTSQPALTEGVGSWVKPSTVTESVLVLQLDVRDGDPSALLTEARYASTGVPVLVGR